MAQWDEIQVNEEDRKAIDETKALIEQRMARLRSVVPAVIDLTCRECVLPATYGHTLDDKKRLLALARGFGFTDLLVATFYGFYNVDIQFLRHLAAEHVDTDGLFAFVTESRNTHDGEPVEPNEGMREVLDAGMTNVMFDLRIYPKAHAEAGRDSEDALRDIERSILFMREKLPAESARRGRIYVNLADFFNTYDEYPEFLLRVLKLLQTMPIGAILYEDSRGTHFHFQTYEIVKLLRRYNPTPRKILVHPHSGNGLEDAAMIDAILGGADGIWAALTPHGGQIGHGSSLMLLSNLMRAGNLHIKDTYALERLMQTVEEMSKIHTGGEGIDKNYPVVGELAYRYIDRNFLQRDRACDLPPESIGRREGWRLTPGWSPPHTISQRLKELGYSSEVFEDETLLQSIRLVMSDVNLEGRHARFETVDEIARLVDEAKERCASNV